MKLLFNSKGQIVVEYVLLLVVSISIAFVLINGLVKKDPNSPGVLIRKWEEIRRYIAAD